MFVLFRLVASHYQKKTNNTISKGKTTVLTEISKYEWFEKKISGTTISNVEGKTTVFTEQF